MMNCAWSGLQSGSFWFEPITPGKDKYHKGWSAALRPPNLLCEVISHLFSNGHDFMWD
jgi:hypothetical protein